MKLHCVALPHLHANCLVAVLGAGKGVKFHKDAQVDLSDPSLGLGANAEQVGYELLAKYPKYLRMVQEPVAVAADKNKAMMTAGRTK